MLRLLPLCALMACQPDSAQRDGDNADTPWSYPLDDVLRVSHGQVIGTHNSYHLRPDPVAVEEWDYSHRPLDEQAGLLGVRQFELDAWWNPETEEVEVYHAPIVDAESTCPTMEACLDVLLGWSQANPAHFPLVVLIEPKDELASVAMTGRLHELDEAVLAGWPAERSISPDQLQGDHPSLRAAVLADGWPVLGALRGKAIFVLLDSGANRDEYTADQTTVAGRPLFPLVDPSHDLAAFFLMDDPEGAFEDIGQVVSEGFMVRTRADSGGPGDSTRSQAALDSGAQCLSTDFPEQDADSGYVFGIPGGEPVGCNPVTAPNECTPAALEDPRFIR